MKKIFHSRSIIFLLTVALAVAATWLARDQRESQAQSQALPAPKYVFLFLADGAGVTHMEITRQYMQHVNQEELVITDKIMKHGKFGLMTTHAANSLSTDSAAAATALASGCKGKLGALGICADGSMPPTVVEAAKQKRMRVGLVTNSRVYDASPAAFVCHVPSRRDYGAIVSRYLETEPDVLLGGGRDQFIPRNQPGSGRGDDIDFAALFEKKGYQLAVTKADLNKAPPGKLLGLFSLKEMSFELDRDKQNEPSLSEMTAAAISRLHDNNPNGFFLFVENENIDSASHLSDIASVIHDFREFDRAVAIAYEFYQKYPRETLILVTSDHETGGLGITEALKDLDLSRGKRRIAGTIDDLKKLQSIKISLAKASQILGRHPGAKAIEQLMLKYFNGFELAPEYEEAIRTGRPLSRTLNIDASANALGMMIANNTQVYWQTSMHTNQPVFVAALGIGSERFTGYYENSEFGQKLLAILNGKRI